MPVEEPAAYAHHRLHGGAAPSSDGLDGTVYERAPKGPSTAELAQATATWLKTFKPDALASKVECLFAERGWLIIWTPPYCPKFQPIELVWGGGKQRAGQLYRSKRTLKQTKEHLRTGFYGGAGHGTHVFEPLDIAGCWASALREINAWIARDKTYEVDGLSGDLCNLVGMGKWTLTAEDCLDIKDMGVISTPEVDDLELDEAGSDSGSDGESDSDSAAEAE